MIIIDNFCLALFSGVPKLTALYNILQHFLSFTNIVHIIMKTNNVKYTSTCAMWEAATYKENGSLYYYLPLIPSLPVPTPAPNWHTNMKQVVQMACTNQSEGLAEETSCGSAYGSFKHHTVITTGTWCSHTNYLGWAAKVNNNCDNIKKPDHFSNHPLTVSLNWHYCKKWWGTDQTQQLQQFQQNCLRQEHIFTKKTDKKGKKDRRWQFPKRGGNHISV